MAAANTPSGAATTIRYRAERTTASAAPTPSSSAPPRPTNPLARACDGYAFAVIDTWISSTPAAAHTTDPTGKFSHACQPSDGTLPHRTASTAVNTTAAAIGRTGSNAQRRNGPLGRSKYTDPATAYNPATASPAAVAASSPAPTCCPG